MEKEDKEWLGYRFNQIHKKLDKQDAKLDKHAESIAALQEKWSMMEKVVAGIAGLIAFMVTMFVRMLWR